MADVEVDGETFAAYLAKVLVAQRGFGAILPPGTEALVSACDRVLVQLGEHVVQVACIVDRDARPDAVFGLTPEEVLAIVQAWAEDMRRSGKRRRMMSVTIYEVGVGVVTAEAERRLAAYRMSRSFGRIPAVKVVFVDPGRRTVLDNARRVFGRDVVFRWLRRLVARPRLSDADLAPGAVAGDVGGMPVLTPAILAALAVVFAAEVLLPVEPWTGTLKADIRTLLAFGGVDRTLVVDQGQWWRMATAPLLHGDGLHILFNGWALWLIGRLSERLMGLAWFGATFTVSALAGSALSIVVNPPNLLSVGASGAIVGLFAASYILSFRMPAGLVRTRMQSHTIQTLIPALLPLFSGSHGATIDYGAHVGGAAGGTATGLLMLALWPKSLHRPRFAAAAGGVAAVGLLLADVAVVPDLANYRAVSLYGNLFDPFPKSDQEAREKAPDMIAAKPHDPRARFAHALALADANDLGGAEAELRAGLAETGLLGLIDPPHYEDRMRVVLGAVLKDEGRPDEARTATAPACAVETAGALHDALGRLQLCR